MLTFTAFKLNETCDAWRPVYRFREASWDDGIESAIIYIARSEDPDLDCVTDDHAFLFYPGVTWQLVEVSDGDVPLAPETIGEADPVPTRVRH